MTFAFGAQKELVVFGAGGLDFAMEAFAAPATLVQVIGGTVGLFDDAVEGHAVADAGLSIVVKVTDDIWFVRTRRQLHRLGVGYRQEQQGC